MKLRFFSERMSMFRIAVPHFPRKFESRARTVLRSKLFDKGGRDAEMDIHLREALIGCFYAE